MSNICNSIIYKKSFNESIGQIANKFLVKLEEIKLSNDIYLIIPIKKELIIYQLQTGDTFYKLAYFNHTTISYLKALNPNLETLQIGRNILIPKKAY